MLSNVLQEGQCEYEIVHATLSNTIRYLVVGFGAKQPTPTPVSLRLKLLLGVPTVLRSRLVDHTIVLLRY